MLSTSLKFSVLEKDFISFVRLSASFKSVDKHSSSMPSHRIYVYFYDISVNYVEKSIILASNLFLNKNVSSHNKMLKIHSSKFYFAEL